MAFFLILFISLPLVIETPFIIQLWLGQMPEYVVPFVRLVIVDVYKRQEEGNRNIINEAFRVLRSNVDFMTGKESKQKVFVVTSFNPISN